MDYLSNAELINKIATAALQPKQTPYSEDPLYAILQSLPHLGYADPSVYNRHKQRLKVSLFYHHGQPRIHCIVFMHGFGSNRLQALNILPFLPSSLSLCCFDFSAEGKSQGKMVTYGKKQKDDIRAVMGYLRNCKFESFVLWGRSMGASAALYFTMSERPHDVVLQILDSPFSSFGQIAFELTKKKINIPDFVIRTGLEAMKKNFQNRDFNPFEVDFNRTIECQIPTLFVYSEDDDVVNCRNTHTIVDNFKGRYEKIIIKENHNTIRTPNSVKIILDYIRKYSKKYVIKKIHKTPQKDIVFNKRTVGRKTIPTEDSFDNYGIWVSSKFQRTSSKGNTQKNIVHEKSGHKYRPKSSIKVFSADMSMHSSHPRSQRKLDAKLNSSMMAKSLSKSLHRGDKHCRYLSHELYL